MNSFFRKIRSYFRPACRVVTHDGGFHTDDVFASAVMRMWLRRQGKRTHITRTRDQHIIDIADIVFDVGQVYDHARGRYDHHQTEGGGVRQNGVPYAAFGLIWKHYGLDVCEGREEVWKAIDSDLVQPIDASDNGVDLYSCAPTYGCTPVAIQRIMRIFDGDFNGASVFAERVIQQALEQALRADSYRLHMRSQYQATANPKILVLTFPGDRFTIRQCLIDPIFAHVVYVVFPGSDGSEYNVLAVSVSEQKSEMKKALPSAWRGKDTEELVRITGVSDIIMCHRSGFLAKAKSKEGAEKLAQLAFNY